MMLDSDEEELDLLSSGGDSTTCLSPGVADHRVPAAAAAGVATPASVASAAPAASKPKIWSLADMAGNQSSQASAASNASHHHHHQLAAAFAPGVPFGPLSAHQAGAFGLRAAPTPFLAPNHNNNNNANVPGQSSIRCLRFHFTRERCDFLLSALNRNLNQRA